MRPVATTLRTTILTTLAVLGLFSLLDASDVFAQSYHLLLTQTLAQTVPVVGSEHVQMADKLLSRTESTPITIGFFAMLAVLAGLFAWLALRAFPEWLKQQEANRTHASTEQDKRQAHQIAILATARADAQADLKAAHELAETQHRHITGDVSGRVERVQEDVRSLRGDLGTVRNELSAVAQKTHSIAAKLGVSILAILTLGGSASSLVWFRAVRYGVPVAVTIGRATLADADDARARVKCDPACARGQHCCGENKCCLDKSDTAGAKPSQDKSAKAKPVPVNKNPQAPAPTPPAPAATPGRTPPAPTTAVSFASLGAYAVDWCDRGKEACL
jgi:hypothetical protein